MGRIVPHACPGCGITQDAVAQVKGDHGSRPEKGDFTICIDCGMLLIFESDLSVRRLTTQEWAALTAVEKFELSMLRMGMRRGRGPAIRTDKNWRHA